MELDRIESMELFKKLQDEFSILKYKIITSIRNKLNNFYCEIEFIINNKDSYKLDMPDETNEILKKIVKQLDKIDKFINELEMNSNINEIKKYETLEAIDILKNFESDLIN